MKMYNVISTLVIGDNTSAILGAPFQEFKKGMMVLDDSGKPYEILSIGMTNGGNALDCLNKANLLIKGHFKSKKMYVCKDTTRFVFLQPDFHEDCVDALNHKEEEVS